LRTTAPDLAKFLLELTSPQHLDPALMAEMTSPQVQSAENESWGLGIGIRPGSQGDVLWHDGNNPDFHALMLINQEQRNGVVILTNGEHGAPLVNEIADHAMTKLEVKPSPTATGRPTPAPSLAPTQAVGNSQYPRSIDAKSVEQIIADMQGHLAPPYNRKMLLGIKERVAATYNSTSAA
jgi:hypothetical protein